MENSQLVDLTLICTINAVRYQDNRFEKWYFHSFPNVEIKIIVDGELQTSQKHALMEFTSKIPDERLEIIYVSFSNPGQSRNEGLLLTRTKWVAFVDFDDIPNVMKYNLAIQKADGKTDVVIGRYSTSDSQSEYKSYQVRWTGNKSRNFRILSRNPGLWRIIWKVDVIKNLRFKNLSLGEDIEFIFSSNLVLKNVEFIDMNLYEYYLNQPLQLTNKEGLIPDLIESLEEQVSRLKSEKHFRNSFNYHLIALQYLTIMKKGSMRDRQRLARIVNFDLKIYGSLIVFGLNRMIWKVIC